MGGYSTLAACDEDGPTVELAYDDGLHTHWVWREGPDGLWYLCVNNG